MADGVEGEEALGRGLVRLEDQGLGVYSLLGLDIQRGLGVGGYLRQLRGERGCHGGQCYQDIGRNRRCEGGC